MDCVFCAIVRGETGTSVAYEDERVVAFPAEGVNLLLADGEVAMQEVMHVHLNVLPRTEGDGLALSAALPEPPRSSLDAQVSYIAAALSRGQLVSTTGG
jgi:diadenosine tetraphosphate (Ap4A) HIT family hydrolase